MLRNLAVASLLFLVACGDASTSAQNQLLRPDDPAIVASGEAIYVQHCALCHGAELQGQPDWQRRGPDGLLPAPPHDPTGHTWHHADQVLFDLTKHGLQRFAGPDYQTAMPAYDGVLSDDDIVAVLSYIKSTWPEDIRARQSSITAAASE